jgi:hypothetical protein
MRSISFTVLSFILVAAATAAEAQTPVKDISAVYAEGKITANEYRNDYFGLTLTLSPVNAQFTQGGFVSPEGKRAHLVNAQLNSSNWDEKYEIAILADALSANPLVRLPEQYVRSVRHQFEREGMTTIQEETPIEISGVKFVQATMKVMEEGRNHYQGMYTTFLNGYILSIQIQASTPERLNQIVLSMVKFKPQSSQ